MFVPLAESVGFEDAAAATRALAARAERVDPEVATTAYIKEDRGREGVRRLHARRAGPPWWRPTARGSGRGCRFRSRSTWDDLDRVTPRDFTIRTAVDLLGGRGPVARAHARAPGACPPTCWRRGTPSRSPGWRPCTRGSGARGHGGSSGTRHTRTQIATRAHAERDSRAPRPRLAEVLEPLLRESRPQCMRVAASVQPSRGVSALMGQVSASGVRPRLLPRRRRLPPSCGARRRRRGRAGRRRCRGRAGSGPC